MHTYRTGSTIFNYNSDFSGDIIITDKNKNTVNVNIEELLNFIKFGKSLDVATDLIKSFKCDDIWQLITSESGGGKRPSEPLKHAMIKTQPMLDSKSEKLLINRKPLPDTQVYTNFFSWMITHGLLGLNEYDIPIFYDDIFSALLEYMINKNVNLKQDTSAVFSDDDGFIMAGIINTNKDSEIKSNHLKLTFNPSDCKDCDNNYIIAGNESFYKYFDNNLYKFDNQILHLLVCNAIRVLKKTLSTDEYEKPTIISIGDFINIFTGLDNWLGISLSTSAKFYFKHNIKNKEV